MITILIIFVSLSIVTGVVTYYGQQVGNFVVGVTGNASDVGLILSEKSTFEVTSPQLNGPTISDVLPITYTQIVPENVTESMDNAYISTEGNYMGYFFYVKNVGLEAVNVDVSLNITASSHYTERSLRAWIFTGEEDASGTVYQLADTTNFAYTDYPETVNFVSESVIMSDTILNFGSGEVIRYDIIIWIEGQDPDCVDYGTYSILKGSIALGMNFNVSEEI